MMQNEGFKNLKVLKNKEVAFRTTSFAVFGFHHLLPDLKLFRYVFKIFELIFIMLFKRVRIVMSRALTFSLVYLSTL